MGKKTRAEKGAHEVEALFPGAQVGKYTVKPWTLAQLRDIYPSLLLVIQGLKDLGVTWENLEKDLEEKGLEIIPALLPHLPALISLTLGIDQGEAEALDWGMAAAIGCHILAQNIEPIKNCSSLIAGAVHLAVRTTP